MRWNNKLFPSLTVIDLKSDLHVSKGFIRHYHYSSNPKLVPLIVAIGIISCVCNSCTNILYLPWESTNKEAFNTPRYGRVYHFN